MQTKNTSPSPGARLFLPAIMTLVLLLSGWSVWRTQAMMGDQRMVMDTRLKRMEELLETRSRQVARIQAQAESNQRRLDLLLGSLAGQPAGGAPSDQAVGVRLAAFGEQLSRQRGELQKQQTEIQTIQRSLSRLGTNLINMTVRQDSPTITGTPYPSESDPYNSGEDSTSPSSSPAQTGGAASN